ncbi:flagellar basal body rod protein FlgB [Paenibacillus turpanensis]|uniref:flagellar basal body rod protein FlgB n=1 Tax=Paenibacillus turpanensis TaxID=2689078 RepID=UPI001A9E74CD
MPEKISLHGRRILEENVESGRNNEGNVELVKVEITVHCEDGETVVSFNKPHFTLLENTLNAAALRQRVIANNISNAETPYFKRSNVLFEEVLQDAVSTRTETLTGYRTDPRHFNIGRNSVLVEPQIQKDTRSVMTNNLNNVDIEVEMTQMASNQLRYNTLVQQVGHEFKLLRTAIGGA